MHKWSHHYGEQKSVERVVCENRCWNLRIMILEKARELTTEKVSLKNLKIVDYIPRVSIQWKNGEDTWFSSIRLRSLCFRNFIGVPKEEKNKSFGICILFYRCPFIIFRFDQTPEIISCDRVWPQSSVVLSPESIHQSITFRCTSFGNLSQRFIYCPLLSSQVTPKGACKLRKAKLIADAKKPPGLLCFPPSCPFGLIFSLFCCDHHLTAVFGSCPCFSTPTRS